MNRNERPTFNSPVPWLGAATLVAVGVLLWTHTEQAPAVTTGAKEPTGHRVSPAARDRPRADDTASPEGLVGVGAKAQLEQTLDGEARLQAQGDAARRRLIERTLPQLVRQAEQAEQAGNTQRAALLRKRIAYFQRVGDEES